MIRKDITNNVDVNSCFVIFQLTVHLSYTSCDVMIKMTKHRADHADTWWRTLQVDLLFMLSAL